MSEQMPFSTIWFNLVYQTSWTNDARAYKGEIQDIYIFYWPFIAVLTYKPTLDMSVYIEDAPTKPGRKYTETGPRLNIKTVLSTYGDFHVKDKTAVRTSYL